VPEPDIFAKQNDFGTTVSRVLTDADGNPVDLSSATVKFRMQPITGGAVKVDADATVLAGTGGTVTYTWGTANLDTPGVFLAEWQATYVGGTILTFPNGGYDRVLVTPDIGTVP
jgi:hypothetical protein